MDKIKEAMQVVQGKGKVDLRIDNAKIADLHNGNFFEGSICVYKGIIVSYEKLESKEVLDAKGAYIIPNFIDAHVHIESSMLSPSSFAHLVLPMGTGTVIADPHEIANVSGLDGIKFMLASAKTTALNVQIMLPSCVPALPFEDAGACLLAKDFEEIIKHQNVLGLGEMMNAFGVINQDAEVMDKIDLAKQYQKVIDGHAPEVHKANLDSYILAGIKTDHECTTTEEVIDRLRRGMYVILRQSSASDNLSEFLPIINAHNQRFCIFGTDDRHAEDIRTRGHIISMVRTAVKYGLDVCTALCMASLNTAQCYGLEQKGSLALGKDADFMLVNSIDVNDEKAFWPHLVYMQGDLVGENGKYVGEPKEHNAKELNELKNIMHKSMNFDLPKNLDLYIASGKARVLKIFPHSIYTECEVLDVNVNQDSYFEYALNPGLIKIAVLERHKNTNKIGIGLLHSVYGLSNGAVATSISHDSHNIIVAGDNDEDILTALAEMKKIGGGITMASNGKIIASLPLELGGLMSDEKAEIVGGKLKHMRELAITHYNIWTKAEAFMLLSFLALPVLPKFRITASGLFDVERFQITNIDAALD